VLSSCLSPLPPSPRAMGTINRWELRWVWRPDHAPAGAGCLPARAVSCRLLCHGNCLLPPPLLRLLSLPPLLVASDRKDGGADSDFSKTWVLLNAAAARAAVTQPSASIPWICSKAALPLGVSTSL